MLEDEEKETLNTSPNAAFSRYLHASTGFVARTLISCKYALRVQWLAEQPCRWVDVEDECNRVRVLFQGVYAARPTGADGISESWSTIDW